MCIYDFFSGGWICHDSTSCKERRLQQNHLMSSENWETEKSIGGILSGDPKENPQFWDANHVFVPYCTSDSWSGTASHRNEDGFTFMGRQIIREVIKELSDFQQLQFGKELFLAGSSAGATGVLVNVDYVANLLSPHGVRVRGIVDSGWFLDNTADGNNINSQIRSLQFGIKMWQANVNDECARSYPEDLWKCYIGYRAQHHIKSKHILITYYLGTYLSMWNKNY